MSGRKPRQPPGRDMWILLPLLLAATFAAYHPAWHGGVLWDDAAHITRPALQSLDGLRRIWFDVGATQQYYPVVYSAFWVQHRLWGDATFGYHLINIATHAVAAFLIAVVLRRLKAPGAVLAAVIFALHPVHVESVAWMTELKNTLSAVMYLLAALVYLEFDERRRPAPYIAALVLFVAAVLSKTNTATLPAALLVVFWWKRGRLDWRRDVVPLIPLLAIGVTGGLAIAWIERTLAGAAGADFQFTVIERCLIASRAVWFYLAKLAWPATLIFIYPRWNISQGIGWQYLYPVSLVALLFALWLLRTRSRAPLAAMLFFCGTLFPAIGFVNLYAFEFSFVADHFQYLASIGIIALVAGAVATLVTRWRLDPRAAAAGLLLAACPLAALTWRQSRQYADIETLYRVTIEKNPSSWMAENNLGDVQFHGSPDQLDEAIAHFTRALEINPAWAPSHNNLGMSWLRKGRVEDALAEFKEAVRLQPRFANAQLNLGNALRQLDRPDEAITVYQETVRLKPDDTEARNALAGVLLARGRPREAVVQLEAAFRMTPDAAPVRTNLATVLVVLGNLSLQGGRPDEAIRDYEEALRLQPNDPAAHNNLAAALFERGRTDEAVAHLKEVVRLVPDSAAARANLARALAGRPVP